MVNIVKSEQDYANIVQAMFSDGKYSDARLYVLELFTIDVCVKHGDALGRRIMRYFEEFKKLKKSSILERVLTALYKLW